jgi:7-cyano-7-deazaguanine synthase
VIRKTFVLHSGGLDSSTALALAVEQLSIMVGNPNLSQVVSVGMNYGQRHIREAEYAEKFCKEYCVDRLLVDMPPPPRSMLTDPSIDIPDVSYADLPQGISPTYVPFRNGQLLSLIAGIAQGWVMEDSDNREATIWFGAHAEDAANWAYPDCTPEFVGSMASAIYIGTYHKVRLITPFLHATKDAIVKMGAELLVPYEMTWSCYKGDDIHCGTCPTCRSRKEAFAVADVTDPTFYADVADSDVEDESIG